MTAILLAIVTSATENPIEVRQLFELKFYAQACGEVFGFKVADALKYLGKSNKGMENALSHIRTSHLGCNSSSITPYV
ncbi:Hypothetical predicted protein [Paramuricea clavata]|uniref:Uncharacterized protein n=1 Tax=Paramuricea clavata TaxID=317549 RepID=A0A6S7HCQ0_PARCT|nr:Hypothetical predicted protein [Paramuricea clavata]